MKKRVSASSSGWRRCASAWLLADRLTRRDDGARKYGPFFEDQQDYDVLFLGTSRVLDGISPMELWRDYGITSYNMGNSSECLEVTEWVLRLALEYHTPRIAVIDVYYVDRPLDDAWAYTYRHMFYDEVPLSRSKIEAVRATLPEDHYLEFLMPVFPLPWPMGRDPLRQHGTAGGMRTLYDGQRDAHRARVPLAYPTTTEAAQEELPGHDALRRIAALCRENGIEPVFVMLPAPISEQEQRNVRSVQAVADELGVPFLNMLDMSGVVNYETDCYDYLGHLNPGRRQQGDGLAGPVAAKHIRP